MPKPYILVTNGVVQCEHGGTVVLKSAVTNHTVGGKIPVDMESMPGSKIAGCPHRKSDGGHCTAVASVSSASTETNVGWGGKHYVVRTIGKTDKGGALVLVDTGQYNHTMNKPGGGSGDQVTLDVIAIDPKKAAEPLTNETCRFHPVRISGEKLRPLRAYRNFGVFTDYHWAHTNVHTTDRVVTYTDAYLYVTHEGQTDEWRILSLGDPYKPAMGQVFYQRTEDGAVFDGIPFFKSKGTVSFLYANVKLSEADRGKFEPTEFSVDPSASTYLNDYGEISKMVAIDANALKKQHLITADEAREGSDKAVATVVTLKDPIGEVEDLYDDYEFSYAKHYFLNKDLFTDIENRNRYAYAVADMLDYLYVDDARQKEYDDTYTALMEQYEILADGVCRTLSEEVVKAMQDNEVKEFDNIAHAIELKHAKAFLDETKFIAPSFFRKVDSGFGDDYDDEHFYLQTKNVTWIYADRKDLAYHGRSTNLYGRRILKLHGNGFHEYGKYPYEVLGLLVFTFCFSKTHKALMEQHPKLKEAAENFYYLLKQARPLPQFDDKAIAETRDILKFQYKLLDVFKGETPLLEEFENLDATLKQVAFDPKAANKLKAAKNYGFDALKAGRNEQREIVYDPHVTTCATLAKTLDKKLKSPELTTLLDKYAKVTSAEGSVDYCHFGINLVLSLSGPRIRIDEESDVISPFNAGSEAHVEWLKHLTGTMNALSEDDALALYELPAKQYYLNALYAYVLHAKMPREGNPKGSAARQSNADAFLKAFAVAVPAPERDISNPLDYTNVDKDLRVKTETENLYANLKNIDGISSKLPDLDQAVREQKAFGGEKSKSKHRLGQDAGQRNRRTKLFDDVAMNSYKASLASMKGLAFIMTVANLGEYLRGNEKLKLHNMVQAGNDMISVTSTLAEKGALLKTGSIKSVSETIEHAIKIDAASMKLVAKLGAVGVFLNGLNDYMELDESDTDAKVAVATKNLLVLALMFTPGWAAVGAIVAVELAWLFLKERVVDSPLELYLQRNLFYNNRTDYDLGKSLNTFWTLISNEPVPRTFLAPILVEAVQSSRDAAPYFYMGAEREAKEVNGFDAFDAIRQFVADNYDAHPHTIERAVSNEQAALKQVLYGMKAEIADAKVLKFDLPMDKIYYRTHLAIDAKVLEDTKHLLSVFEGHYTEIDPAMLTLNEDKKLVDMAEGIAFKHLDGLKAMEGKERGLIIVNDDIVLKYTVQYHNRSTGYMGGGSQTLFTLKELKSGGLSAADYEQVNKLLEKEGN